MAYSRSLAERIRSHFGDRSDVQAKQMVGGVGFMLEGNMCVGMWTQSLVARIGPERYEAALEQEFVTPFDVTGRQMRGWVLVGPEAIDRDEQLREWLQQAERFAAALPPK